jgi:hypothetical protein
MKRGHVNLGRQRDPRAEGRTYERHVQLRVGGLRFD